MAQPSWHPVTYEDLLALPDHVIGQIIDGELHVSPRPRARHARASSVLGGTLGAAFDYGDGPGGWRLLDEPELHFRDDVLVPDLAGWRRRFAYRISGGRGTLEQPALMLSLEPGDGVCR